MQVAPSTAGLYGDGRVCGPDGAPLRPGGPELTERLLDRAAFPAGGVVVDVGCGQGTGVAALSRRGLRAIGVDRAAATLQRAREREDAARFLLADAVRLPFATGSLDGVLSECVLSTMPDRRAALAEWARVVAIGGHLALSDVFDRADPLRGGAGALAAVPRDLAADLAASGFAPMWFEDCSEVLKNWVARFVFAHGSLDALWGEGCGCTADGRRPTRPGYFMLIAARVAGGSEVSS